MTGALSEVFAAIVVQMDGDGSVCGKFRGRRRRLLGGRLEEEGGEVVSGDSADTRRKACLRLEEEGGRGGDSTDTRRKTCLRLEEEGGGGGGSAATRRWG